MGLDPLTIGELFPADDPVARWVFGLTAAVEDLSIAEERFRAAKSERRGPRELAYAYRQLVTRLYEAQRSVVAVERDANVQGFVLAIPDAVLPYACLGVVYLRWPGSRKSTVEVVYGEMRHRTVHHSWPNSRESRSALEEAAGLPAVVVIDRERKNLHYDWVETVAARALLGDLANDAARDRLKINLDLAQATLSHFRGFLRPVLGAYAARVGIDLRRLVVLER